MNNKRKSDRQTGITNLQYRCRGCGEERAATANEIEFGRVMCYRCGATCDPLLSTIRTLDRGRRRGQHG